MLSRQSTSAELVPAWEIKVCVRCDLPVDGCRCEPAYPREPEPPVRVVKVRPA